MWGSATTREQLRGSIDHLGKLNQVPERPKENILVPGHSARQLNVLRENEIASNLAFLSATSDDSLKVMAVCVEEHPNGMGITIRIASNSGDLSEVIGGFRALASSLEEAARRALQTYSGDPSLKRYVPDAIGKLGRYYSASSELVCAARDKTCQVFQNIRVEPFQILVPAPLQGLNYKVHAEIQLLFFYELYPDQPRPRIVCSSKSACYLCNIFFQLHGGFNVPRTHGRLYEKWILPDWIEVPERRRRDFGLLATELKATLDSKIQVILSSRRGPCYLPNESILLPDAHWPSSSANSALARQPSSSTSTLRPNDPLMQEGISEGGLSREAELSLTPPIAPFERLAAARRHPETIIRGADLEKGKEGMAAWSSMSLVRIGYNELPYSHSIALTTPTLHLQRNKLLLTVEFVKVFSGHLSITQVGASLRGSRESQRVHIKDIPADEELKLHCPPGSTELIIQLEGAHQEIFAVMFMWDGP